jgi:putative membrane protein
MPSLPSRCLIAFPALLPFLASPALAHGPRLIGPEALPYAWTVDPLVIVPLLLVHWLYGRGLGRLWGRAGVGRGIGRHRAAAFIAGEAALVLALIWPLDALGETLFSAHMTQHMVLIVVAAPLLVLGEPLAPVLAGLPEPVRRAAAAILHWRLGRGLLAWLTRPWVASLIQGVILWLWHVPAAFEAALEHPALHALEHAAFLTSALLFWWSVLHAGRNGPFGFGIAAFWMLITVVHGGLLGALITFAQVQLYPGYGDAASLWGMDALTDQQLAGLIMWVPTGMVHLTAGVLLVSAWLSAVARHNRRTDYTERRTDLTEPS